MKKILSTIASALFMVFGTVSISFATTVDIDSQNNQIWGVEWPAGDTVTLTIEDPNTPASPDYTDSQTASSEIIFCISGKSIICLNFLSFSAGTNIVWRSFG